MQTRRPPAGPLPFDRPRLPMASYTQVVVMTFHDPAGSTYVQTSALGEIMLYDTVEQAQAYYLDMHAADSRPEAGAAQAAAEHARAFAAQPLTTLLEVLHVALEDQVVLVSDPGDLENLDDLIHARKVRALAPGPRH